MLDPCYFRPSSADLRRAKKREAQRKYRRGIRLRSRASTGAKKQAHEDRENDDDRPDSSGVMPPRDRASESDDDWSSIGAMLPPEPAMAPAQAQQEARQQRRQPQRQQQQQQQPKGQQSSPTAGREKRKMLYHGQTTSPAFSASHFAPHQATLPFADRFDDMFSSDVFPYDDGGRLMRGLDSHQPYLQSAGLPGPMDSLNGCQRCTAFPCAMGDAIARRPQPMPWKVHPEATEPVGRGAGMYSSANSSVPTQSRTAVGNSRSKGPGGGLEAVSASSLSPATGRKGAQQTSASSPTPSPEPRTPSSPSGSATGLQGCTPLFQAVLLGNLKIATILAGKSSNPHAVNELGQTILHAAAQEGHVDIVDYLLRCGADLNACDDGGNTPLHLAVVNGKEKVVEMLVNAGANMDIVNRPRREPGMRLQHHDQPLMY